MFHTLANTFLPRESAATIERLGHPASGVIGWIDPASAVSTGGMTVTRETALTIAAFWCGVRIIAETIGTLPCILYRTTTDDSRERAKDDPRYFLMHDEPHPEITPGAFFETQTAYMVTEGNCYSRIVTDGLEMPVRLEPRMPDKTRVEVDGDRVFYTVTDTQEEITSDEMLHAKGIGGDGITGWSVIKFGASTLGGVMAATERANAQHANNAMPTGAIIHPMRMEKPARENLRREWNEIHGGAKNQGKLAILHGGMDFKPFSMTNEDAQFIEQRLFGIRDVARLLRIPLHMLYDLENSSVRANIEQAGIEFLVYSMAPWLTRWQQALNRKLLKREERTSMYFEFLLESLLRGDINSRYAAYQIGLQNGFQSVNEVRRAENMPPIDGGDAYLSPLNMVPANQRTPDSLTDDMQGNLVKSLNEIMDTAKGLKLDIEAGRSFNDAIRAATVECSQQLKGLREDRELIRQDIAELGTRVQVQGMEDFIHPDGPLAFFRAQLACLVKIEKAEAMKAARKQASRGESFLKWLDEWYAAYPWHKQQITDEKFQAAWVAESKRLLLEACDGPAAGFVDRVQETVNLFSLRVMEAKI